MKCARCHTCLEHLLRNAVDVPGVSKDGRISYFMNGGDSMWLYRERAGGTGDFRVAWRGEYSILEKSSMVTDR